MVQQQGETLDKFHTRLQIAAKYCEYTNVTAEIKSQLELGTTNKKIRRHAFRNPDLTLTQLLTYSRTLENTEKQATGIEKEHGNLQKWTIDVNKMFVSSRKKIFSKPRHPSQEKTCSRCGLSSPHTLDKPCAAKGQTCRKCNGRDHFARVCKKVANRGRSTPRTRYKRPLPPKPTRVNVVEDSFSSGDESDYAYVVSVQDQSDQDSDISFEPELA